MESLLPLAGNAGCCCTLVRIGYWGGSKSLAIQVKRQTPQQTLARQIEAFLECAIENEFHAWSFQTASLSFSNVFRMSLLNAFLEDSSPVIMLSLSNAEDFLPVISRWRCKSCDKRQSK
jgi:hypothetical protein